VAAAKWLAGPRRGEKANDAYGFIHTAEDRGSEADPAK